MRRNRRRRRERRLRQKHRGGGGGQGELISSMYGIETKLIFLRCVAAMQGAFGRVMGWR